MPVQLTRPRAGWAGPRRHRHGYSHEGGDRRRTPRPSGGAIPSSSTLRPRLLIRSSDGWERAVALEPKSVSPVLRRGDGRPAGARSRPARHAWVKEPPRD